MRAAVLWGALGLGVGSAGCASIVGISDVPPGADGPAGSDAAAGDAGAPGPDGSASDASAHDTSTTGADASPPADVALPDGGFPFALSNLGVMTFNNAAIQPFSLMGGGAACGFFGNGSSPSCNDSTNPEPYQFSQNVHAATGSARVYVFQSLELGADATLDIEAAGPVIFVSLGDVTIAGTLDLSADPRSQVTQSIPAGPGAGAFTQGNLAAGGGGGSCVAGGSGASPSGPPTSGGVAYGMTSLVPLETGSAGGGWDGMSVNGCAGGALQISAAGTIHILSTGVITANGGGGVAGAAGGGGGSGGSILLEAPTVIVDGILEANGGGGGDANGYGANSTDAGVAMSGNLGGNGGAGSSPKGADGMGMSGNEGGGGGAAGRIRLNGNVTLGATAIVSPAMGSALCTTIGTTP